MKKIDPKDWIPSDGMILEENALRIVKSLEHELVIAGPGAGKTELLAQKASFLLQTNECKFPRKILAISFKKDAARNLKERVEMRCGQELALRFDSLTFDAFALQIFSRFKNALPEHYLCSDNYEVVADEGFILGLYEEIDASFVRNSLSYFDERDSYKLRKLLPFHYSIDFKNGIGNDPSENVRYQVWQKILQAETVLLTYKSIMLLAEQIILTNPKIKQYLQATYQYIFLDEVQDTTSLQYNIFKNCFLNSDAKFTAVGDDKQRIMKWAGALDTIFEDFENDVGTSRTSLDMNFRCAPRIVELLNYLSEHLLKKTEKAIANPKWDKDHGECLVWKFSNPDEEKEKIYLEIQRWINQDNVQPRDICILVKQQLNRYAGDIIEYLNSKGIFARDESQYQDILSDELSLFILHFLYLVSGKEHRDSREYSLNFFINISQAQDDTSLLRLTKEFSSQIKVFQEKIKALSFDEWWGDFLKWIFSYALEANYPKYNNDAFLSLTIQNIKTLISTDLNKSGLDLQSSIESIFGLSSIPVMTIHRSKGLEYHSVIFIGLEDGAFWTYQNQQDEDQCAFFVALSRAKERIVFTFSNIRADNYGNIRSQSTESIDEIYAVLKNSGVVDFE